MIRVLDCWLCKVWGSNHRKAEICCEISVLLLRHIETEPMTMMEAPESQKRETGAYTIWRRLIKSWKETERDQERQNETDKQTDKRCERRSEKYFFTIVRPRWQSIAFGRFVMTRQYRDFYCLKITKYFCVWESSNDLFTVERRMWCCLSDGRSFT